MKVIRCNEKPCLGAIHQVDDYWITPDNAELKIESTEITGTAVRDIFPARYDLDSKHPLYGKRTLFAVPAGHPDVIVGEDGALSISAQMIEP